VSGAAGSCRVNDIGHAVLATIPRLMRTVAPVSTRGAARPPALDGLFLELARAVGSGEVGWEDARGFIPAGSTRWRRVFLVGSPSRRAPSRAWWPLTGEIPEGSWLDGEETG
jgi:hypothetical protein